ncbi:hypothetical protein LOK74_09270 [Brevibacillus humidisoli]|uniref:hypothetical protein n=1 Tax=Brevibacillus humidisoli TaxID=2895522 RepID=UPI001E28CF6A|nr:hypothetical protein [Brevibacillus humidisoli]UFJ42659.1 hypothetical protein LOK74_09270 [Brevibacillus humidisoli]
MEEDCTLITYLESMVGKVLRVYESGLEPKHVRLIAVKGSCIVVDADQDGLMYYNMEHIKFVCEDFNETYPPTDRREGYDDGLPDSPSFNEVLVILKHQPVRVDQGGPKSQSGRILKIGEDFFALHTGEDGVVYYKTAHVKSLSQDKTYSFHMDEDPEFVDAETFVELLENLQNCWVTINQGGSEAVEGLLMEVQDDHVTVMDNQKVFRIAILHIRNIAAVDEKENSGESMGEEDGEEMAAKENRLRGRRSSKKITVAIQPQKKVWVPKRPAYSTKKVVRIAEKRFLKQSSKWSPRVAKAVVRKSKPVIRNRRMAASRVSSRVNSRMNSRMNSLLHPQIQVIKVDAKGMKVVRTIQRST